MEGHEVWVLQQASIKTGLTRHITQENYLHEDLTPLTGRREERVGNGLIFLSFFLFCFSKIHDQSNLRKGRVYFSSQFEEIENLSWWRKHGARC